MNSSNLKSRAMKNKAKKKSPTFCVPFWGLSFQALESKIYVKWCPSSWIEDLKVSYVYTFWLYLSFYWLYELAIKAKKIFPNQIWPWTNFFSWKQNYETLNGLVMFFGKKFLVIVTCHINGSFSPLLFLVCPIFTKLIAWHVVKKIALKFFFCHFSTEK